MPRKYKHIKDYEKELIEYIEQGHTLREAGEKYEDKSCAVNLKAFRRTYTAFQAERDLQIMTDSFSISKSTKKFDTFITRYKLCYEKADILRTALAAKVRGIDHAFIERSCQVVEDAALSLKLTGLNNCFENQVNDAESLKTNKGKLKRYRALMEVLECNEDFFADVENYHLCRKRIERRISDLENDTPALTVKDNVKNNAEAADEFIHIIDSDLLDMSQKEATNRIIENTDYGYAQDIGELGNLSKQRSDLLADERQKRIMKFDPYSVEPDPVGTYRLSSVEKNFLKQMHGQSVDSPTVYAYWTYQYNIDFSRMMTVLLSNGFLKISRMDENLDRLTVADLKEVLAYFGLAKTGKKAELLERIKSNVSSEQLRGYFKDAGKIYSLTEKGKEALADLSESATKDLESEDECLNLIAAGKLNEAYVCVCENEMKKTIPRGIGIDWEDEAKRGLSQYMLIRYTDFFNSDLSNELPDELIPYQMELKACCILCNMLGASPDKIALMFIRIAGNVIEDRTLLNQTCYTLAFKI